MTVQKQYPSVRRLLLAVSAAVLSMAFVSSAEAQLTLRGTANPTINISTGTAGGSMASVVNTSSTIRYRRQAGTVCKITVRATCPSQSFHLAVVATGVTRGMAASQVDLTDGMLAVNFITDIPGAAGWLTSEPTLRYTASAEFSDGNSAEMGNDVYNVTYTLQAQ